MTDKKMPEPMDAGAPERAVGEATPTNQRPCYAAKTLIAEVLALFPETTHRVSDYNGRNVGLWVTFDTAYGQELTDLLLLVDSDARVERVEADDSGTVLVIFHNRPRIYDLRDSFGLDEAWSVLEDDWEGGSAAETSDDVREGGGA